MSEISPSEVECKPVQFDLKSHHPRNRWIIILVSVYGVLFILALETNLYIRFYSTIQPLDMFFLCRNALKNTHTYFVLYVPK